MTEKVRFGPANPHPHQEQPLEDVEQAREALKKWAAGLYDIWKAHH